MKMLGRLMAFATVALALTVGPALALSLSTAVKNARLDAIESTIGTSPILRIYDDGNGGSSIPANCAASAVGNVLATITLPSDWMAAASNGAKAKNGTWQDTSADADGTAEYFRIYDSTGTTCHIQGTVSKTGGGGELTLDNDSIASGQSVTITGFTLTEGN